MLRVLLESERKIEVEPNPRAPYTGQYSDNEYALDVVKIADNQWHVIYNHKSYTIVLLKTDPITKSMTYKINGKKTTIELKDRYDDLLKEMGLHNAGAAAVKEVKAPMPGLVLEIKVEAGKQVNKDEPIIVLEAMKMENVLKAPVDGVIKSVQVKAGNAVEKNQVLVNFE